MRAVADTNIVVSAILWGGPPRQLLDAARVGKLELFTSAELIAELLDVLSRDKFAGRIRAAGVDPRTLALGYAAVATLVRLGEIPNVIHDDPDDDVVLACAIASSSSVIVSGDSHLLKLGTFNAIKIMTASECLKGLG
jgi:uncharacterized protein